MKKSEIAIGKTYTNGKVLRRVLAEGPQYKMYDQQADRDCISYAKLNGKREPYHKGRTEDGYQILYTTRIAFAAWAKSEVRP